MGPIAKFLTTLPQETGAEIVAQRDATPVTDREAQQRLSIEERRDLTRQAMRESIPKGVALAAMAPLEQVGKAAIATPVLGPIAETVLKGLGLYEGSRSGFHNPAATIGGTWAGALQGLNDRGLFR